MLFRRKRSDKDFSEEIQANIAIEFEEVIGLGNRNRLRRSYSGLEFLEEVFGGTFSSQ